MLSERAKGKRRAVDLVYDELDDLESQASSSAAAAAGQEDPAHTPEPTFRDLVVRFTEGAPDLTISVDKLDSVRDVKRRIRETRPELQNRRLRLIHSGRLLTDGTLLYAWLASLEERQQRADTLAADAGAGAGTTDAKKKGSTTWIHCSVGPVMDPEAVEEDTKAQTSQIQPLRGFDRLASVGFSPEDIENFRRQFHSQSSSNYLDLDFATEEEYDEHARALEEQWIDSMDNVGSATLSQSDSSSASVLQGMLVGFFFPFLPLFFMRSRKPAVFWDDGSEVDTPSSVVFSRRMSMGITVGFLVNILFGMWRLLLDSS